MGRKDSYGHSKFSAPTDTKNETPAPKKTAPISTVKVQTGKTKGKENKSPSLKDILLGGETIKLPPSGSEPAVDFDIEMGVDNVDYTLDVDVTEEYVTPVTSTEAPADYPDDGGKPIDLGPIDVTSTPSSLKIQNAGDPPVEVTDVLRAKLSKSAEVIDADAFDLAEKEPKVKLEASRTRSVASDIAFRRPERLPIPSTVDLDVHRRSLPAELDEASDHPRTPCKPKVKFDERLRYKSASFDDIIDQEEVETVPADRIIGTSNQEHCHERNLTPSFSVGSLKNRRKSLSRLSGGKPASHVSDIHEDRAGTTRGGQTRKDTGLDEFVNVCRLPYVQDKNHHADIVLQLLNGITDVCIQPMLLS